MVKASFGDELRRFKIVLRTRFVLGLRKNIIFIPVFYVDVLLG